MGRRRRAWVLLLAMCASAALLPDSGARAADPAKDGTFSAPFAEDPLFAKRPPKDIEESKKTPPAVSMAMLPDGRVIYWGGLEGLEGSRAPIAADGGRAVIESRSRILDLSSGTPRFSTPSPEAGAAHDLFCADQRLLADGRLLAVGGTIWEPDPVDLTPITGPDGPVGGTVELFGSNAARIFDPASDSWRKAKEFMQQYRWYPTLVTLPDGRLFVAGGVARLLYNFRGTNVHETEIYDPATEHWKNTGETGSTSLPLFARLHLMPDGTIFYDGVGQMWGPFGQGADEALWNVHKAYDPKKNAWTTYGMGVFGARSGAFSIMMPLEPPYKEAKLLIEGGTLGTSPGSYVANNFTEIVTVKNGNATSERGPDLNQPRWYSSGVLLPDGTVVAMSGANRDEVIFPGSESPVTQAELFDGKKWTPLANAGRVRTYHNTAMLLPDGSILVGGHSPINAGYGPGGDNSAQPATGTNNLKDPSFEIYRPPYLFRGDRPVINHAPKGIRWGSTFNIATGDAGDVKRVVMMRLPAVTHITDADQRAIVLDYQTNGGSIRAQAPPNGAVAPPGYYYLFVLSGNGDRLTPSKAHIVHVGASAMPGRAAAPMGR